MRRLFFGVVFLFSLAASAGTVSGMLPAEWLVQPAQPGDPHFWQLKALPGARRSGAPALVALFSSHPRGEQPAIEIQIAGFSFSPSLAAGCPGQRVVIRNESGRPLSCQADGKRAFFFENLGHGDKFEAALGEEGLLVLRCQKHPFMRLILVSGTVAYSASVDAEGKFQLGTVAAGDYTLKVLVGEKWVAQRDITVGPFPLRIDLGQPPEAPAVPERPKEPPPTAAEKNPPAKPEEKPPQAARPEKPPPPPPAEEKKQPQRPPKTVEAGKVEPKPPTEDPAIKNVEPEIEVEEE